MWFYDVEADGWSLDDKRTPLLPEEKLEVVPRVALTAEEHAKNNLPDILARCRSISSLAPVSGGEGRGEGAVAFAERQNPRPRFSPSHCSANSPGE